MREIGKFITTTKRADVDAAGSTADSIYAEAVLANMPTLVVKENGLLMTKDVPGQVDSAVFPIFTNMDLSWTNISGTGSDLGSEVTATAGTAATFKKITPVQLTSAIFVTDAVDLTVNKADFELYSRIGGVAVQKKMDQDAIADGIMAAETAVGSLVYAAGGFTANGSISAGSTLTPTDASKGVNLLSTGSNIYPPNVMVMHPNQYNQFVMHQDFSPNANTAAFRKATFNNVGKMVAYDGMQIVVTELVNAGSTGPFAVAGHPVALFTKGLSGALATKQAGFRVTTEDRRLNHGQYKIFDIMFKADVLIPASICIIRAAD